MDYGKGLEKARRNAGLSQRKLGQLAGLDPSYVSQLEAGKRRPSLEALEKLANAAAVPINVLFLMCAEDNDLTRLNQEKIKAMLTQVFDDLERGRDAEPQRST
jgi:transcriptional regulator with XRE-family HTH domain